MKIRAIRVNRQIAALTLGKVFRQSNRLQHCFGFVHRFLKFLFRDRIVHPPAAGLDIRLATLQQRGANGNAAIEVPVEGKIADASAIGATRGLFQFGNNLHGTNFWRRLGPASLKRGVDPGAAVGPDPVRRG